MAVLMWFRLPPRWRPAGMLNALIVDLRVNLPQPW